jgi:hypothetical protein
MNQQYLTNIVTALVGAGGIIKHRIVDVTDADRITVTQAAAEASTNSGIAQETADAGEYASVGLEGIGLVEAGGAVAGGDFVIPDADGKGITDAAQALTTFGQAMTSAGAEGDLFLVKILK